MKLRTWSGQDAEHAWHWNRITYQKIGNVVYLFSKGDSVSRTRAYHEYIDVKRWFIEDEFEELITKLDKYRRSRGAKPLRDMITDVYREMLPVTNWKANDGPEYSDIMPDLDLLVPEERQEPNGVLPVCEPPVLPEIVVAPVCQKKKVYVECEQLSLF